MPFFLPLVLGEDVVLLSGGGGGGASPALGFFFCLRLWFLRLLRVVAVHDVDDYRGVLVLAAFLGSRRHAVCVLTKRSVICYRAAVAAKNWSRAPFLAALSAAGGFGAAAFAGDKRWLCSEVAAIAQCREMLCDAAARDDDERAQAFWQPRLEREQDRATTAARRERRGRSPRASRQVLMGGLGGESGKRLVGVSGPCNAARLRAVQAGERPLERAAARSKDRPGHYCTKNCSRSGAEAAPSEEAACSRSCPTASKRVCRPRSPGLPRLRHSPQRTRAPAPVKQDALPARRPAARYRAAATRAAT